MKVTKPRRRDKKRAVALKYIPTVDQAPKVVAKGEGKVADRIIHEAQKAGVTIQEDPELVELLSQLDWYEEIPAELYTVVAEILAFAYKLNSKLKSQ